jgi:hypothetical protein
MASFQREALHNRPSGARQFGFSPPLPFARLQELERLTSLNLKKEWGGDMSGAYRETYRRWLADPDAFWREAAQ